MSKLEREIYKDEPIIEEDVVAEESAIASSDDYFTSYEETPADEDFEARTKKRRARMKGRKVRRKLLLVVIMIALFATLATMCGRDIIRLKAENIALQKQQKELEEERDKLKAEVERSGKREYVQEQARKQLRLLNPGELLFTFDEEEAEPEVEEAPAEEEEAEPENAEEQSNG